MALHVYNNNPALVAQKNLTTANTALGKSIEKISTGERINHAQDDAANIAISDRLRVQMGGVLRASMNAQDAISFLQTADSGMEVIGDVLHRMYELSVQAGNGVYSDNDRREMQNEMDHLKATIDEIANTSEYNAIKLLGGDAVGQWSTDNNALDAIMRSDVAEGNYRFKFSVDPGRNAVYKTNVLFDGATIDDVYKNAGMTRFNDIRQSNRVSDLIPFQMYRPEMASISQTQAIAYNGIPEVYGSFTAMLDGVYNTVPPADRGRYEELRPLVSVKADVLDANDVGALINLRSELSINNYLRMTDQLNYTKVHVIDGAKVQTLFRNYGADDITYRLHPTGNPNENEVLASSGTFIFTHSGGNNYAAEFTDANGTETLFVGAMVSGGIEFTDTTNANKKITLRGVLASALGSLDAASNLIIDNIDTNIPPHTNPAMPQVGFVRLDTVGGTWDPGYANSRSTFHLAAQRPETDPLYASTGKSLTYHAVDFVNGMRYNTGMKMQGLVAEAYPAEVGMINYRSHLDERPERLAYLAWHTTQTNRTDFFMGPLSTGLTPNGLDTAEEAGVANIRANGAGEDLFSAAFAFTNIQQPLGASLLETFTTGYPGNSFVKNGSLIESINSSKTGYIQVEFTDDINFTDVVTPPSNTGRPIQATFTFIDAETGEHSIVQFDQLGSNWSYTANVTFEVGKTLMLDFKNGVRAEVKIDPSGYDVSNGDKMLFAVNADINYQLAVTGEDVYVTVNTEGDEGSRTQSPTVRIRDGMNTGSTITTVMLKDGQFLEANLAWDVIDTGVRLDNAVTLERYKSKDPEAPKTLGAVRIGKLPIFTTAEGRNILEKAQTLSIYCNDKQVDVTIDSRDTMRDLVEKLGAAIADGLGADADGILNSDLVSLVTAPGTGNYALMGTIVIQTALIGDGSRLYFKGSEELLNALGIATIQEERNSEVTVAVLDAHTNQLIGQDTIKDQMLRNVIDGVDVRIDSRLGVYTTFDSGTGKMLYTADEWNEVFLHILNQRTDVQVGANEGLKIDISVERVDTLALGINDVYVTTQKDAQVAITKIGQAQDRINSARAKVGAQVDRMENAMRTLKLDSMGMTAAESRIRDLDMADESAALARNKILVNAGVAMVAQANQAPMTALDLIH